MDRNSIVLDNGSSLMKVGFSGDDKPKSIFKSIVGLNKHHRVSAGARRDKVYVGGDAQSNLDILSIDYPIKRGIIVGWDDMEKIWNYAFYNELQVAPEEHTILLTDTPLNPINNREKMSEIMFETFNTPAISIKISSELALYASGMSSGLVIDIGYGVSSVLPIYEGSVLRNSIQSLNIAGCDITELMMKTLTERGHFVQTTPADIEFVNSIKEKNTFISLDFEKEFKLQSEFKKPYTLPDGQEIIFGNEQFCCPEVLFQPSLFGMEFQGIHKLVHQSITKCDEKIQKQLNSLVLSGGSTMLPGVSERLEKELNTLDLNPTINIIDNPNKNYINWVGGSILASLSTFGNHCISKEEYDEHGVSIINKK